MAHKYDYECRCPECQAEHKRIRECLRQDWIKAKIKLLAKLKKSKAA